MLLLFDKHDDLNSYVLKKTGSAKIFSDFTFSLRVILVVMPCFVKGDTRFCFCDSVAQSMAQLEAEDYLQRILQSQVLTSVMNNKIISPLYFEISRSRFNYDKLANLAS